MKIKLEIISSGTLEDTFVFLNDHLISDIRELYIHIEDSELTALISCLTIDKKYDDIEITANYKDILTEEHKSEFEFEEKYKTLLINANEHTNVFLDNFLINDLHELIVHIKPAFKEKKLFKTSRLLDNINIFQAFLIRFDDNSTKNCFQIFN